MNKTQELKERIYKHCPELKELTFGCAIRTNQFSFNETKEVICANHYGEESYCLMSHRGNTKMTPENITKILGHPIHLEHVLRGINDSPSNIGGFTRDLLNNGYSLTKSFEQNCENSELVDFLLDVIK